MGNQKCLSHNHLWGETIADRTIARPKPDVHGSGHDDQAESRESVSSTTPLVPHKPALTQEETQAASKAKKEALSDKEKKALSKKEKLNKKIRDVEKDIARHTAYVHGLEEGIYTLGSAMQNLRQANISKYKGKIAKCNEEKAELIEKLKTVEEILAKP